MEAVSWRIKKLVALVIGVLLALCLGGQAALANEPSYEEGHILVTLEEGANPAAAAEYFAALSWVDSTAVVDAFADDSMGDAFLLPLAPGVLVIDAVAWATECSLVDFAQPDYVYDLPEPECVVAESLSQILSLTYKVVNLALPVDDPFKPDDPKSYWHLENIGAGEAWQRAASDHAVTVAILDSGCRVTHEDLAANVLAPYAYNAYTRQQDVAAVSDLTGHGTHVAGIIAAQANNALGTAGVSSNAYVLPIRVFYINENGAVKSSTSAVKRGYTYLLDLKKEHPELNIRIANISLGGYTTPDAVLQASIREARDAGILTVCAAGNGGKSSYIWPSDFDECLSVTALSSDGMTPADYSDFNVYKDICAPGSGIYSTVYTGDSDYDFKDGTSMAAPVVSGALALLWSAYPQVSIDEMVTAVQATAAPLSEPAGREGLYGAGRLDVDAALSLLEEGGIASVQEFAPGVFQLAFEPVSTSGQGVPSYWGTTFYWDAAQQRWVALINWDPQSFSGYDLVFHEEETPVIIPYPGVESKDGLVGDANGNGILNIVDAQVAYDRARGAVSFDADDTLQWLIADVNGDGYLDSADSLAIQYAVHYGWDAAA